MAKKANGKPHDSHSRERPLSQGVDPQIESSERLAPNWIGHVVRESRRLRRVEIGSLRMPLSTSRSPR
jgi:hypothetical protein